MPDIVSEEIPDIVPPRAGALIESLRAFGYSLKSAVADIVDNSITAEATTISGLFWWEGEDSWFVLQDNGNGMTEQELVNAMRLGSQSPLDHRARADLGRFGLGLKTASFSQCRRLTVVTKISEGSPALRCWDLDHVEQTDKWQLLREVTASARKIIERFDLGDKGTLVLWEKMDHVTQGMSTENHKHHGYFNDRIAEVHDHLSMVFHDFLRGGRATKLSLNDRPVHAWDPFLLANPATQQLGEESIAFGGETIKVVPYVLPHHSRLDEETHSRAAGPGGWNAQQGFYVFRANRLIVAGDWLGLGFQKEEHYKLARIRVDIPNTMDQEWNIDVRKSRARPPAAIRERLLAIAKLTRSRAAEVYRHRGKIIGRASAQSLVFPWLSKLTRGKNHYIINREHPLFEAVKDDLAGNSRNFLAFMRLIEETIPVPSIVIGAAERPNAQRQPFDGEIDELLVIADRVYDSLLTATGNPQKAMQRIITMEPFSVYADEVRNHIMKRNA